MMAAKIALASDRSSRCPLRAAILICAVLFMGFPGPLFGEENRFEPFLKRDEGSLPPLSARRPGDPMTMSRLDTLIRRSVEAVERNGEVWRFDLAGQEVHVIANPRTDRMRIVIAVGEVDGLDASDLYRLLEAGFLSTHDARYALAQGIVWSVYVHPLRSLSDMDFLSGLGQSLNLARSYGTSFSSGLLPGADPAEGDARRRQLIEELLSLGDAL